MGTLIDRFDEHDGPVRGVHFHPTQPLFVSGGDDYKIKVWNYKQRRCLFTLLGHLDYIRTVQFHHEYPWIVTASDDQTIRIWNWQSRNCIAVLTGHNHYVMCAQFHPKEDLVVSASLDQTVRVWDIAGLRKKNAAPGVSGPEELRLSQMNADIFGGGDAVVKYVLEGHDRGVNWASFHPSLPLVVSGADDRQVKLWRMNDTKAWEVDTLRGHVNNVSCVLFHPKQDLIVSDSEDKSLRVWDMSKRVGVQTFRREHDRFWILAAHPEVNLLAAGHDSGMIVFKLERERPAYAVHGTTIYYVKDRYVRAYDCATQRDNPLVAIRRNPAALFNQGPRNVSYNPAEHSILIQTDVEGGTWELYPLPRDSRDAVGGSGSGSGAGGGGLSASAESAKLRGTGNVAVFIARNRFAVLDKGSNTIVVRDLRGDITKKVPSPLPTTEGIFYAGTGLLLVRSEDKVALFDVQQRTVLGELATPPIKYVVWSGDMEKVALLSKHAIVIADKRLENSTTVHETIRIKSAAWDQVQAVHETKTPNGNASKNASVLIYTTLNHIKYALPSGDSGVVRTLDAPLYLCRVHGSTVYALDREAKPRTLRIDTSEFAFKAALAERRYDAVISMIRTGQLCGQAIIAYLQEKGYPEVALYFVKDERMRFNLAVECGNVEVALQSARELDDAETWTRLGVEALRQGNHQIVEYAYQKTKNYERLSFLYLITGDIEKLVKMQKIADARGDAAAAFHNSLFLGTDYIGERVRVLRESGQEALAQLTEATYGNSAEESSKLLPATQHDDGLRLAPPTPILRQDNWPLLTVSKGFFESLAAKDAANAAATLGEELDVSGALQAGGWGDDMEVDANAHGDLDEEGGVYGGVDDQEGAQGGGGGGGGGGWEDEELEGLEGLEGLDVVGGAVPSHGPDQEGVASLFANPAAIAPGPSPANLWATTCQLAAEQAAAGEYPTALRSLSRQAGISEFASLAPLLLELNQAAYVSVPMLPSTTSISCALQRSSVSSSSSSSAQQGSAAPALPFSLNPQMEELVRRGYRLVTEGKFAEALSTFTTILCTIPFLVVDSRKEADEVVELLGIARDYHTALRCELARRESKDDPARAAELAAYFTHCNLQRVHLALSLRSAMTITFKLRNFNTCATFCRRLLDLQPDEKMVAQARQVLAACERSPVDQVQLRYDPRNPFDLCPITFTPIYKGNPYVEDPYTKARFQPECEGQVSPLGEVARVGGRASGLVNCVAQLR